ncbi:MAG: hypothetical protein ACRDYB_06255 [Acidimicrobiales bacterium]
MIGRLVLWLVALVLFASLGVWVLQLVSDGWGVVVLVFAGAAAYGWYLRHRNA